MDEPVVVLEEANGFSILLGDVFHAVDTELTGKLGVTRILCAAKRCKLPPADLPRQVLTVTLTENGESALDMPGVYHTDGYEPASTSATRLEHMIEFLAFAKANGGKVLVLCSNGKNRSVAVVLAWLMHEGMTLQKSVELLKAKRPEANVCAGFFTQLQQLEVATFGGETTVKENPFAKAKA